MVVTDRMIPGQFHVDRKFITIQLLQDIMLDFLAGDFSHSAVVSMSVDVRVRMSEVEIHDSLTLPSFQHYNTGTISSQFEEAYRHLY